MISFTNGLDALRLHAELGEQQLVLNPTEGDYLLTHSQLQVFPFGSNSGMAIGQQVANSKQMEDFSQQVAAQTEQLPWLAYRLQLEPLVQRLHGFIRSSCCYTASVLRNRVDDIFTPHVLEVAGTSGMAVSRQALVDGVLMQELVLADESWFACHHPIAALEPINLDEEQKEPLDFEAVLRGEVQGIPSGTTVHVCLDLFGLSSLQINEDKHMLHLRIGHRL
jgi:hypothetical protein